MSSLTKVSVFLREIVVSKGATKDQAFDPGIRTLGGSCR